MFTADFNETKVLTALELISLAQNIAISGINIVQESVKADDVVQIGDDQEVTAPRWLKAELPRRVALDSRESLVDLALPLASNPFHLAMRKHMMNSGMLKAVQEGTNWHNKSHVLIVGSSGISINFLAVCRLLMKTKNSQAAARPLLASRSALRDLLCIWSVPAEKMRRLCCVATR